jgi:cell division inhibitor SepF
MAERLKRAAAWLGLVTDDRYGDYDERDDNAELTEGISRADLLDDGAETTGNVTPLESRRPGSTAANGSAASAVAHRNGSGSTNSSGHLDAAGTSNSSTGAAPTSTITTPRTADMARITTVHPRTYNEARVIGEHFRDGVPVIMNLSEMEDADAKRLVDFAAGLIFGLRGTIERVTSKVFLLCPPNVNVSSEDKERIAGGFFNQS